jgi:hypothetical protein
MIDIVVFIDGTWIWHNIINSSISSNNKFDLGQLPGKLTQQFGGCLLGTILCASIPVNYHPDDEYFVTKRRYFER